MKIEMLEELLNNQESTNSILIIGKFFQIISENEYNWLIICFESFDIKMTSRMKLQDY